MQELKSVTQAEVQVSHGDAFRHVNNARIMEYLEIGRRDIMNLRGRREAYVRKRLAVPVASMQVNFHMPAQLGQLLDIKPRCNRSRPTAWCSGSWCNAPNRSRW